MTDIFSFEIPKSNKDIIKLGNSPISSWGLVIATAYKKHSGLLLVIVPDVYTAEYLIAETQFFLDDSTTEVLHFPDWETLPYDHFSPAEDLISTRILTLYKLSAIKRGIMIVPLTTLMHRLCPKAYIQNNSLVCTLGDKIDLVDFKRQLITRGYLEVQQVHRHGEFSYRGSIIDVFPSGTDLPYRIDLCDNEIDSIRVFDEESQRTINKIDAINLLPACEFPLDEAGIETFRSSWRAEFGNEANTAALYLDVSQGINASGLQYYLPLFFDATTNLLEYLPKETLLVQIGNLKECGEAFLIQVAKRYEDYRHDLSRPILAPMRLFININDLLHEFKKFPQLQLISEVTNIQSGRMNLPCKSIAGSCMGTKLNKFLEEYATYKIIFTVVSHGRKEILQEILGKIEITPTEAATWDHALKLNARFILLVSPLEHGLILEHSKIVLITEDDLRERQVVRERKQRFARKVHSLDDIVKNLAELKIGQPVVHIDHGVGIYKGLCQMPLDGVELEFVVLEYANQDKLYVPVTSLHLIYRYNGINIDTVTLHALGSSKWADAKRKVQDRVRDTAGELLAIYAKRNSSSGFMHKGPDSAYEQFVQKFPFNETPDQKNAIDDVIKDLISDKPMDRVICGDVGFGKTEVAMRAAFLVAYGGKQVAMLVPTTLLAQQHYQNFCDRFSETPLKVANLSRFVNKTETRKILENLAQHKIDIVIGTHKLLSEDVNFQALGLVIIDEEHRFGVKQKEQFKALKASVDILTLTATPIPRTLNMAMSGVRDLSIITTPPAKRLAVKTFVHKFNKGIVKEAILREIMRGGQVYYLHNEVASIDKTYNMLCDLLPDARIALAHGQLKEAALERIMLDFYHRRFNVLICSTIIETGIDVPNANTIIIERADKFGLAQLHQLRGRVGRSHHQAYAFCLLPEQGEVTDDSMKRLHAISKLDTLGVGFMLATHDLEIRGAGEILGDEQSGHISTLGYNLYMELLEKAVVALKEGHVLAPDFDTVGTELDLQVPAFIPDSYIGDVNLRLVLYKRLASVKSLDEIDELKVEFIDRFGILPEQVKYLFKITQLKFICNKMGIKKIKGGNKGGTVTFKENANINFDYVLSLVQVATSCYKLQGNYGLSYIKTFNSHQEKIDFVENLINNLNKDKVYA